MSSGPAAASNSHIPSPLSAGRYPPWHIGIQEGGDLHIHIAIHTQCSEPGQTSMKFKAINMVGTINPFFSLKKPQCCLLQSSTINLGIMALSLPYGLRHCRSTGPRAYLL